MRVWFLWKRLLRKKKNSLVKVVEKNTMSMRGGGGGGETARENGKNCFPSWMLHCATCLDPVWGINGSLHKLPLKMIWAECLKANNLLYSCVLPDAQWLHRSELCQAAVSVVKPNACYKTCFSQSIRRKWSFQRTYVIHLHLGFII